MFGIKNILIKHPMYVGVPNMFFNTKMYVRRIYVKRGSIGVRTQNICFQEEKPIVGRVFSMSKDEANSIRVDKHSVVFYMGTCREYFCTPCI